VREGAVGAELVEDFGEGCFWHGDFAEVVQEGDLLGLVVVPLVAMVNWDAYDAVICAALSAEVQGLVFFTAVVDHTVREHGLVGNAEDEHAEGEVL
jgi:hypothetical protein